MENIKETNNNNKNLNRKAWGIARVSTNKQIDSLEVQTILITGYLESNNHLNLDYQGLYVLHESAYSLTPKKLDSIVKDLPKHSAIIISKVDRLSRNTRDFAELEKIIKTKDVEIHFIQENIVWNKDTDRSTATKIASFIKDAEEESNRISKRVKDTNVIMRKYGKATYNLPLGYQNYQRGRDKGWEVHPVYGQLVLNIFERYATGKYSISRIIEMSYNEGLKGRISGKKLCKQAVINILQNKAYIGKLIFEGKEFDHHYGNLVPVSLFMKCQDILNQKSVKSPTKDKKQVSPFAGFIMSKESNKLFAPYETKGNIYFKSPDKGVKDLKSKDFHNALISILNKISSNKEMSEWMEYELNKNNIAEATLSTNKTNSLRAEIKEKETRVEELLINPPKSAKPEQVDLMIARLNREIDNLQVELQEAEKDEEAKNNTKHIRVNANFANVYNCHKMEVQTEILHLLFDKIWYKDGRATFVLKEKPVEMLNQETFVSMI